jgi:hypothetical protein
MYGDYDNDYNHSDMSSDLTDFNSTVINNICEGYQECDINQKCKTVKYRRTADNADFSSLVVPLTDLTPMHSYENGHNSCIEFMMRRKNRNVSIQWEPFKGSISVNGITHLNVVQTICNLPPYKIYGFLQIKYKDVERTTYVMVDPHPPPKTGNLKFFLNSDGSSKDINANDVVEILGGQITWTVERDC